MYVCAIGALGEPSFLLGLCGQIARTSVALVHGACVNQEQDVPSEVREEGTTGKLTLLHYNDVHKSGLLFGLIVVEYQSEKRVVNYSLNKEAEFQT